MKVRRKQIHKLRKDSIDIHSKKAFCHNCGFVKISIKTQNNGRIGWRCSVAHSDRSHHDNRYLYRHISGLPVGTLRRIGECEICRKTAKLYIDHNHKNNCFRGFLCHHCNTVLGFSMDNVQILSEAIKYLNKNS